MPFKLNHYAQPIKTNVKSFAEVALLEFCICVVCGAFAYVSYGVIIQLFLSCLIISIVCFFLAVIGRVDLFGTFLQQNVCHLDKETHA